MRKSLIIILLIITSCNEKLSENYRGYVYSLEKKPLNNVKVYPDRISSEYTYTQKDGFFSLKRGSLTFLDNLIFEKDGYITDSLETVYYHRGHGTIYLFLTTQSDTLFMRKQTNNVD